MVSSTNTDWQREALGWHFRHPQDRSHLVTNIVGHASDDVTDEVQLRVIAYWTSVDTQLGLRVADGLGQSTTSDAYLKASKVVESRSNRA